MHAVAERREQLAVKAQQRVATVLPALEPARIGVYGRQFADQASNGAAARALGV